MCNRYLVSVVGRRRGRPVYPARRHHPYPAHGGIPGVRVIKPPQHPGRPSTHRLKRIGDIA